MKLIERKSLLLAISLSLILLGFLLYYMRNNTSQGSNVNVYVAATDIEENTEISSAQVTKILLPEEFLVEGCIIDGGVIEGKVAVEKIFKGEQIIGKKLIDLSEKDDLPIAIPLGYSAVSISADAIDLNGCRIKSGDYVDVMVYLNPPVTQEEIVKTIFQDVLVLNSVFDNSGASGSQFVTLSLTSEGAEKLYFAAETGKIKLVLRQRANKEIKKLSGTGSSAFN